MASATPIAEISRNDLEGLRAPPSASITNVKHLSSYNWIEAPTPTIAVPGSPSLWSPPQSRRRVQKDSGLIYIAQNAARHPDSPLEPLFRALYITNPSFDIRSIDIVTDRNNIRKLLSFINPSPSPFGKSDEPFTINIEVAGNTAVFSRAETATIEYIGPDKHTGFGHEFEKAYTTSQISGSTGHHRIISYCFGDLKFILRHETDGYVDPGTGASSSKSQESENDSLSDMLGSLALSSGTSAPNTTPPGSKLTIREEGDITPLESTLEIKTRSARKQFDVQEVIPQLWVSQTPKFVIAYHYSGLFQPPNVQDLTTQIKKWEESNQTNLRKLAALINKIRDVVKGSGGKAVLKYDVDGKKLVIEKDHGNKMLPQDLYSRWDYTDNPEAETKIAHDASTDSAGSTGKHGTEAETKTAHGTNTDSAGKHEDRVKTKAEDKSTIAGPGDGTKGKTKAEDKSTVPGSGDGTEGKTKAKCKSKVPGPRDTKSKGKATEAAKEGPDDSSTDCELAKVADSGSQACGGKSPGR